MRKLVIRLGHGKEVSFDAVEIRNFNQSDSYPPLLLQYYRHLSACFNHSIPVR